MCRAVLVARSICQFDHPSNLIVCWQPCGVRLEESRRINDYDLLCSGEDGQRLNADEFELFTDCARLKHVDAYNGECDACMRLEQDRSCRWARSRDNVGVRKQAWDHLRQELASASEHHIEAEARGDHLSARMISNRMDELPLKIEEARRQYFTALGTFNNECRRLATRRIESEVLAELRNAAIQDFEGVNTRRFYRGQGSGHEEHPMMFSEGNITHDCIQEY